MEVSCTERVRNVSTLCSVHLKLVLIKGPLLMMVLLNRKIVTCAFMGTERFATQRRQTMAFPVCFPLGLDKGLCYPSPAAKQFCMCSIAILRLFAILEEQRQGKVLNFTTSYQVCLSSQPIFSPVLTAGTNGPGRDQTANEGSDRLWINTKIRC